jgi:hypothetical protein
VFWITVEATALAYWHYQIEKAGLKWTKDHAEKGADLPQNTFLVSTPDSLERARQAMMVTPVTLIGFG